MAATHQVLKLRPELVTKPWGLKRPLELDGGPFEAGVGEVWLASAQTGPGNRSNTVTSPPIRRTLAELLKETEGEGEEELRQLLGTHALGILRESPHRGKTEAWHVRQASGRTGIATGPRTPRQRELLRDLLVAGELGPQVKDWPPDVRDALGIIGPLSGGEVFLVPCGTLHTMFAAGPESRLVLDEIQQGYGTSRLPTLSKILMVQDSLLSVQVHPCDETVRRVAAGEAQFEQDLEANPTVRVYDFGRRPGIYPEFGFQLTDLGAGARRVTPLRLALPGGASRKVLVACRHFVKSSLTLLAGAEIGLRPPFGSYHVISVTEGSVRLEAGAQEVLLEAGEVAFVPGALEEELRLVARAGCRLFDDSVPDLTVLRRFAAEAGAGEREVASLLDPPRAPGGSA